MVEPGGKNTCYTHQASRYERGLIAQAFSKERIGFRRAAQISAHVQKEVLTKAFDGN